MASLFIILSNTIQRPPKWVLLICFAFFISLGGSLSRVTGSFNFKWPQIVAGLQFVRNGVILRNNNS